jgi:HipA-like protein
MAARRPAQPKVLEVVLDGVHAGRLTQNSHGRLSFDYDDGYRERDDATPLSLSMLSSSSPRTTVEAPGHMIIQRSGIC